MQNLQKFIFVFLISTNISTNHGNIISNVIGVQLANKMSPETHNKIIHGLGITFGSLLFIDGFRAMFKYDDGRIDSLRELQEVLEEECKMKMSFLEEKIKQEEKNQKTNSFASLVELILGLTLTKYCYDRFK